jgi:phage-related protein
MIAGFTINGSVYPAQSGTTINFDRNVRIQNVIPKRVSKFGDGYKSHLPIGSSKRRIDVSFTNRSNGNIIETYFELLNGASFDITLRGETVTVVCAQWQKTYPQEGIHTITATLQEYYD